MMDDASDEDQGPDNPLQLDRDDMKAARIMTVMADYNALEHMTPTSDDQSELIGD